MRGQNTKLRGQNVVKMDVCVGKIDATMGKVILSMRGQNLKRGQNKTSLWSLSLAKLTRGQNEA